MWEPFHRQTRDWQVKVDEQRSEPSHEVSPSTRTPEPTCGVCGCPEFNHNHLPTVQTFYDTNHEWVMLNYCLECCTNYFVYGVELCRIPSLDGEDEIWTYAVPVTSMEVAELETLDWRREMVSWENNAAKRLVLSRRRRVFNPSGRSYWSNDEKELGMAFIPPG
jgi:hypothetical protein